MSDADLPAIPLAIPVGLHDTALVFGCLWMCV
jgi:hypothetical protein